MQSLTTGAAPHIAIEAGLYVQTSGGVAAQLVPRIDLRPASTHLVVGGIGTGKTTQLLIATKWLEEMTDDADVQPLYVDVSTYHDLSQLKSGVLLVIAGLALDGLLTFAESKEAQRFREQFRKWAEGYTEWQEDWEYEPDDYSDYQPDPPGVAVRTEGILVPPEPPLDGDLSVKIPALKHLIEATLQIRNKRHLLLLVDSLDRVTDIEAFSAVVTHDVRALRDAGVGVVLVGPLRLLFGTDRPITDRFDRTYHVPAVDIDTKSGLQFLMEVLRLRSEAGLMSKGGLAQLAHFSGGVLRDLIGLTQAACEEAYVSGGDLVDEPHVQIAADAFGRSLMLGLGADEIEALQRVRREGAFIQTSDKDVALLVTRRVLEYGEGSTRRYAVHPTIDPLLDQLATK